MRAMVLERPGTPLQPREVTLPPPSAEQVLVRVRACGVCRTDLHVVDGELAAPKPSLVPGHEVVGEVVEAGHHVREFAPGDRVGVPWLGSTCGTCEQCLAGRENLCERPAFTGYTVDGGYAEYALADARYCLPLPERFSDAEAAPLLCAGLIGYRCYLAAGEDARRPGARLGIYGFGAAAHLLCQVAAHQGLRVFAFTRPGDERSQAFARDLGAAWAGGSDERPPEALDAAVIFAPVGALVPAALAAVRPGGTVVCGGIHMSDIPAFPYSLLWGERVLRSVANLTREDGRAFMRLLRDMPLRVETVAYPLSEANRALDDLRHGRFDGAAVLLP